MILEEEWIRFEKVEDIENVLMLSKDIGIGGRGIIELDEDPYIEFDDPIDGTHLMDIGQYFLTATIEEHQRSFILDPIEFEDRLKSDVVIEFQRLINILLPVFEDHIDVYSILSDVMEVNICTDDAGEVINVGGYDCKVSLNFNKDIPSVYIVRTV